jgi:hypothetical protein
MPLPLAYTQNGDENAGREIKIDDSQWGEVRLGEATFTQKAQFFFPSYKLVYAPGVGSDGIDFMGNSVIPICFKWLHFFLITFSMVIYFVLKLVPASSHVFPIEEQFLPYLLP